MSYMSERSRSAEVRREARRRLAEIRQERLARRATLNAEQAAKPSTTDARYAAGARSNAPEITKSVADIISEGASAPPLFLSSAENVPENTDPADTEKAALQIAKKNDADEASVSEKGADDPLFDHPDEPSECTMDCIPLFSELEDATAETDLERIPGIGPGLIWMLAKSSVTSLRDLANADAGALKSELGVVGTILDIDRLISLAQECVENAA